MMLLLGPVGTLGLYPNQGQKTLGLSTHKRPVVLQVDEGNVQ